MKSRFIVFVSLALTLEAVVALTVGAGARAANERRSEKVPAVVNAPVSGTSPVAPVGAELESAKAFLGRWDLTLKARDGEYPSWLELRQENGRLVAEFVGRWGNARPLPKAELSNGRLMFISPKEEEGAKADMVFEGTWTGKILSGTVNGPDGNTWQWTGERAPALTRTLAPKWGPPIQSFNGKDLTGWHMSEPSPEKVWKVENGELISPGNGPELINDSKFGDFKLHVEFNCGENSNGGVYLRGRYEVQIETDSIEEPRSHHMGGIYGFLAPTPEQPRRPGEWQTYDITLVGRMVTVVQNGHTIIDNKEIPGITGGALDSHEELPGPLYLQGSEKGRVAFRSIVLTPAD
ncbi:MAG: DUF1080 domain-containing protein [Acidobacteria bacterium]|nr:MAG: DUF1080 domain-containing protein [Acidobacteriota bacterium]